jgi:hypothetical protein
MLSRRDLPATQWLIVRRSINICTPVPRDRPFHAQLLKTSGEGRVRIMRNIRFLSYPSGGRIPSGSIPTHRA